MEDEDQSEANKQSKETQDLAAHKKHTEMLQRLSNMHHSRLQQIAARRSAADSSDPSFETVQSFLSRFSDSKLSVEADLQRCRALAASDPDAKPQIKAELDKVSASISDLERLVAETSYFLPPYEKFSFKSKASSNRDHPSALVKEVDDLVGVNSAPQSKIVVTASPGFRNKQGEILVKTFSPEERDGEFSLNDLDSCDVYLKGRFRALFIHRLNNCHIFAGPVLGSILREGEWLLVHACISPDPDSRSRGV
ncbi:hypothetical protein HPP92_013574 [Vanilla planifolia]|uniref:Tubulin-folding cofactor C n=1 Tax=Vanilla planifolia TaxID=51239 RepID=A0A835V045_VANPL|nr:hypothetical protein HPP92_014012 [Vanilla planifolia]KAG0478855.1 hypothetical protein HPP92_013574 [Vanilla planifolia]